MFAGSGYKFGAGLRSCCEVVGSGTFVAACGCLSLTCGGCETLVDFAWICLMRHFLASFCCCFGALQAKMSCLLDCCRDLVQRVGSVWSSS